MKNKKFKNGYLRLTMFMLISFAAGLHMVISPESVSLWEIRGVGSMWVLEGIFYAIKLAKKK